MFRSRSLLRLAVLAAAALSLGVVHFAATPACAQTSRDVYFDWPVGTCPDNDGRLVFGRTYYVQRDFETINRIAGRCTDDYDCHHAGLDLSIINDHDAAIGQPVFSTADGRVACEDTLGQEGDVIVIEHPLPDGTSLYSSYLHLDEVFVKAGEPVRRGQPIGTIIRWPWIADNDHLHFEIRDRPLVWFRPKRDGAGIDTSGSCAGNGYSIVDQGAASDLGQWGFLDPADVYFSPGRRPPFPARVLTQVEVPGAEARDQCTERLEIRPAATIPDPDSHTTPNANASEWLLATGIATEADSDTDDADDLLRGWYQIGETGRSGYLVGFEDIRPAGINARLCVGETYRVGRQWQPPAGDPLVELRFAPMDWDGTSLVNWAPGGSPGTLTGAFEVEPAYASLPDGDSDPADDDLGFCDQTGLLGGGTAIEVALGPDADFRRGLAFEAMVRLNEVTGTRLLAGRWETGSEQWKLEVDDGDLVLTVRQAAGISDLSVRYTLPAPRCKQDGSCSNVACLDPSSPRRDCVLDDGYRKWVHVGVISDAFDRNALELYWDGVRVARAQQVATLAESTAPVRIGDGVDGQIDNVTIWELDPRNRPLDLAFVIDTTGSMSDDLAAVKSAATQIVNALEDASADYRVAVTDFRDFPFSPYGLRGVDYPYRVHGDFSNDRTTIVNGINALRIGSGGDLPESVYSGVLGAILGRRDDRNQRLSGWRASAQKIVILMGDAPPHDPEPVTGFDISDVLTAAVSGGFEIGDPIPNSASGPLRQAAAASTGRIPVRIFSVLIGGNTQARSFFRQMAEGTNGQLFAAPTANQVVQAILDAIGAINGGGGGGLPPVNQAPEVAFAHASREQIWPPNQQMERVAIQGVVDPEGDPVTVTITGITQDEPVTDKGRNHTPDGQGVGTAEALLRAERSPGSRDGRVYQITFTATDAKGASSTGAVRVCVPHDPSPNTVCLDDGQTYDSTRP